MRRALHVMQGLGPQETLVGKDPFYDHPFFGQLFMAASLSLLGYSDSLSSSTYSNNLRSIEMLYFVPRVLMGVLSVTDTFLVYKIAERKYKNRSIALIASVLFAVMPMTWPLRRILLDSIQLPLILFSILFALYLKRDSRQVPIDTNKDPNSIGSILAGLSGIFLGLAVFTKVTACIMIPLIVLCVMTSGYGNKRSWKMIGIWLIPVILIPSIWPAYALLTGQYDDFLRGLFFQTHRHSGEKSLLSAIRHIFLIDPILLLLSICGLSFAAIKRDYFILIWFVPYLVFLFTVGYVAYYHFIPLLPVICILTSRFLYDLSFRIIKSIAGLMKRINRNRNIISSFDFNPIRRILPLVAVSMIGIVGFTSTTMLLTTSHLSGQFETAAYVISYLDDEKNNVVKDITVVSSPVYSWILSYIYGKSHILAEYRDLLFLPIETNQVLLISDSHFRNNMKTIKQLQSVYDLTHEIKTINGTVVKQNTNKYPYTSMVLNLEGGTTEIRIGTINTTFRGQDP